MEETLTKLVAENLSQYEIASRLNISQTNVRYWLKKYGLKTFNTLVVKDICNKWCPKCLIHKSAKEFYKRRKNTDLSAYCIDCTKMQSVERHKEFKQKLVEYKGGCCIKCGYNKYYGALDFHHINPDLKVFSFGKLKKYVLDEIVKKELDKCILICANCHREEHKLI